VGRDEIPTYGRNTFGHNGKGSQGGGLGAEEKSPYPPGATSGGGKRNSTAAESISRERVRLVKRASSGEGEEIWTKLKGLLLRVAMRGGGICGSKDEWQRRGGTLGNPATQQDGAKFGLLHA